MCLFGTGVAAEKTTQRGPHFMFNDPQGRGSFSPAQGKRERPWVSVASPWSHPPEEEEGRTPHPQLSLPRGDSAACDSAGDTRHPQPWVLEQSCSLLGCSQTLCLSIPGSPSCHPHPLPGLLHPPPRGLSGALGPGGRRRGMRAGGSRGVPGLG